VREEGKQGLEEKGNDGNLAPQSFLKVDAYGKLLCAMSLFNGRREISIQQLPFLSNHSKT